MKKIFSFIFLFIFIIMLSGCINKQGISLNYYPECKEYYDYYGVYHKKCENNIYNFDSKTKNQLPPVCLDCN